MVCIAVLLLAPNSSAEHAGAGVDFQLVASGVPYLTDIQHAGDGSGRLFLVQHSGRIMIFSGGQVQSTPFLDLSSLVLFSGEQGLLGLAFHPQYATNGVFFVHYTSPSHTDPNAVSSTVVARYHVSAANPNLADPAGQVLLTCDQPVSNHKGGQIRFGPDGYLYIALGDGGGSGDPFGNGQRVDTLLAKLLRIDVNDTTSTTYAIPPGNLVRSGARPEIWAYGLRNPWRFSFDRATGDLFVADVGQGQYEEVDYHPAAAGSGINYGWNLMEGFHCFAQGPPCTFGTLPVIEYSHSFGCSITGGFRYRGGTLPALAGAYIFADYCTGRMWAASPDANGAWSATQVLDSTATITTFGEDPAGELYAGDYATGSLYRLVASTAARSTLTVTKSGRGAGRIMSLPVALDCGSLCGVQLDTGTGVTMSAEPEAGSTFVQWTGNADCVDGAVSLDADRNCVARFGIAFTDDALVAGVTTIKAVHISELRARVDALRTTLGLTAFTWTDPTLTAGVTRPRAVHVTELRTALTQAYVAAGRAMPTFTTPGLGAGDLIRGVYITELRLAVHLLED